MDCSLINCFIYINTKNIPITPEPEVTILKCLFWLNAPFIIHDDKMSAFGALMHFKHKAPVVAATTFKSDRLRVGFLDGIKFHLWSSIFLNPLGMLQQSLSFNEKIVYLFQFIVMGCCRAVQVFSAVPSFHPSLHPH